MENFFIKVVCIFVVGTNTWFFNKNGGFESNHILAGLLFILMFALSLFLYIKLREEFEFALRRVYEKIMNVIAQLQNARRENVPLVEAKETL
jgi:hypothetical protein